MQLGDIPLDQAVGAILVHNIVGPDGHKLLSKGHLVRAEDLPSLRAIGKETVYAAVLAPDDVREDSAAVRLARLVSGEGIEASSPAGGRVNLYAAWQGFLRVNDHALTRINELPGVTLATRARYSAVAPKKIVATLKTIGLALPESTLREAERIAGARGTALSVARAQIQSAGVILTGSETGRTKTQGTFVPPIRARLQALGAQIVAEDYVPEEPAAIAGAIDRAVSAGAQMILLAGETSVMDAQDITPRGIQQAGGEIEIYGAPVEPGNLLLLAYRKNVPIVGAPGCIKSPETNVVDLILPRLLIGERVKRADVIALAEGGLLL